MTEPRSGPASSAGQPGSGPPASGPQPGMSETGPDAGSTGSGSTGSGSTGGPAEQSGRSGMTTATRATAGQATVPQQAGQQSSPEMMTAQEPMQAPYESGGNMVAAAAAKSWAAVLIGGLCLIAAGVILLVWPNATLTVVAVLIGIALIVSGLVRLYEGFTARGESGGMRAAYVMIGLLAVLAGLYALRHHSLSLFLVAFLTGVYFVLHGIADLGVAFSGADVPARGLRAVLGVFSIGAGIVMVVWPSITLVLLVYIVGAWLILYGLVLGGLAFGLRRAARSTASAPSAAPRLAASSR
jgi:uncharacterized membrane protein HdeD (DUF308 family)